MVTHNFIARLASQCWKMFAGDKVDSAYGNENMSYSETNSLIKAVEDEKLTKIIKRTADIMESVAAVV
jgi:hypothetical protein